MSKNSLQIDTLKNSRIFEECKEYWDCFNQCAEKFPDMPLINSWHKIHVAILFAFFAFFFAKAAWHFFRMLKWNWKSHSQRNSLFFALVFVCFFAGAILYYYGYDYAGTYKNSFTLLLRAVLSSFEMFLSKSNLIGIAENCKNSHWYMLTFAIVHALAVVLSAIFAVACFKNRIVYWMKSKIWGCGFFRNDVTYVFWGLNERSYMLARDVYEKRRFRERILFVDFPDGKDENTKSQGFSGLIGLLSFKMKAVRQLSGINYILHRSFCRPSELSDDVVDFFDELDLMKLKCILKNSRNRKHFIFTDNESSNLRAAINMLKFDEFGENTVVYCAVRKTKFTAQLVEHYKGRLVIIDDSRIAVTALKKREVEYSTPIEYVTIDRERAAVTSVFKAMIIGFGATGQDALRFLYEFSALPDEDGNKQRVRIDVIDTKMDSLEGEFRQEVPAIDFMKVNKETLIDDEVYSGITKREVALRRMDVGSDMFYELLSDLADSLNYVVIATGDDDRNLSIASYIMEFMMQNRNIDHDRFRMFVRLYNESNRSKFESAKEMFCKLCDDYKSYGANKDNPRFFNTPFVFFGHPQKLYTKSIIIENSLEKEARRFYEEYCRVVGDKTTWDERRDKAHKENKAYAYRALYRKESQDKANCMHRYTKEKLLGIDGNNKKLNYYKEWTDVLTVSVSDNAEQKKWKLHLIQASICEHIRWNAAHLMMGYIPMPCDKVKHIDSSADEQRKEHEYLLHWNKLNTMIQSFDYGVVKTTIILKNEKHSEVQS